MKLCLIIDDVSSDAERAKQHVSSMGMLVKTVRSGSEGLRTCQQSKPDIILLSAALHDIDGISFLQKLREQVLGYHFKVIMYSSNATAGIVQSAKQMGVSFYLLKPLQKEQLSAAFEKLDLFE